MRILKSNLGFLKVVMEAVLCFCPVMCVTYVCYVCAYCTSVWKMLRALF